MKTSLFLRSAAKTALAPAVFGLALVFTSPTPASAQGAPTPKQALQAQLAAAGAPVDGTGATTATMPQFKAAVLAAIEANPEAADAILIEALKMIRQKLVGSYLDREGRYSRDGLIDLFRSAVEKYGPQRRPSAEARERLEEMLRQSYDLFPELIGDFRESIDYLLTEELRRSLDDLVAALAAAAVEVSGVNAYFSLSNPGNVGGESYRIKFLDIEKPRSRTQTSGGAFIPSEEPAEDTGTTPATPVVP